MKPRPGSLRGFGHLLRPTYTLKGPGPCPGEVEPKGEGWACTHCLKTGTGEERHREKRQSRIWYFKYGYNGKTLYQSTKAFDREVAEEFRRGFLTKLWGGRLPWEPWKEATLGEVLERGITKAEARGRRSVGSMRTATGRLLGKMLPSKVREGARAKERRALTEAVRLGGGETMPASGATEEAIDAYIAARQEQGYKPATINQDLAILRRAFRVAFRTVDRTGRSMVARLPNIEMLEVNNVRQGFFSEEEYRAILQHLPWCLPNLLTFYRVTGYRHKEPLTLTWDQVDFENGLLRMDPKDTKSGKWRADWPFEKHPEMSRVIAEQWALKTETERELRRGGRECRGITHLRWGKGQPNGITHVFFWEDGRPIKDWRHWWQKARLAAGLPHRLIHDFRRTAYSELIRTRVVDPKTARRMIGAKTSSIGDRYHIVLGDDEAAAAEALGQLHAERAPTPPAQTGRRVLPFASGGHRTS